MEKMTDERMDAIIGNLLRVGVSLSAAIVAVGGIWYLIGSGSATPEYTQFHPTARGLRALITLPAPLALIEAGLLLLIATPVARVIFSLIAFAIQRDRMYVGFTLAVLAILLYSLGTSLG